jgi:nicotinate-nucleotide pyrophosphorylase (carboxylating)
MPQIARPTPDLPPTSTLARAAPRRPLDPLPHASAWSWLVDAALREDIGTGDVTSRALLAPELRGEATLVAREPLVLSGIDVARRVFAETGCELFDPAADGTDVSAGGVLGRVRGPAASLLTAERTALNFLQRLCGVATQTARYCARVAPYPTEICDTRKTTPGWRVLEKYAVRCGGGRNHRTGLYDGVLIKDNHVAATGSVERAVSLARERAPFGLRIQVEVESPEDAAAALAAGADALLADNQTPDGLRAILGVVAGRVPVEATGGITLANVADYAAAGADRVSIGALTHSAPAVDISLEWTQTSAR